MNEEKIEIKSLTRFLKNQSELTDLYDIVKPFKKQSGVHGQLFHVRHIKTNKKAVLKTQLQQSKKVINLSIELEYHVMKKYFGPQFNHIIQPIDIFSGLVYSIKNFTKEYVSCYTMEPMFSDVRHWWKLPQIKKRHSDPELLKHLCHQLIETMAQFHESGYIYQDISTTNFCVRRNTKLPEIVLIDFGGIYEDATHRQFEKGGTDMYVCLKNESPKFELNSFADDMESVAYIIWEFTTGQLPWWESSEQGRIELKQKLTDAPPNIRTFIEYCRQVPIHTRPDYNRLLHIMGIQNKTIQLSQPKIPLYIQDVTSLQPFVTLPLDQFPGLINKPQYMTLLKKLGIVDVNTLLKFISYNGGVTDSHTTFIKAGLPEIDSEAMLQHMSDYRDEYYKLVHSLEE
jgi:serine/threonine protein kinase